MAYRKDRTSGRRVVVARIITPGQPISDFDADETPDLPNITPGDSPPALRPRYVAPADLYIERPELGPGVHTLVLAGYEIRPADLGRELRSAATGRRVKPKVAK